MNHSTYNESMMSRARNSEITSTGFKKAIVQKCKVVVIDLDMHRVKNKCTQLAKYIHWRLADFNNGIIISCYVVKNDSAVFITAAEIEKGEEAIISEFKKWIYSRNYRPNIDVRSLKLSRLLSTSIYIAQS